MPLTPAQQKPYRPLVNAAWQRVCQLEGWDERNKVAKDQWYRQQLHRLRGIYTTRQASHTRDFLPLMAGFEEMAENGIYWQARSEEDRLRRVRWSLNKLMTDHDVTQEYVQGITVQMYGTRDLLKLTDAQTVAVITALKKSLGLYHGRKKAVAA